MTIRKVELVLSFTMPFRCRLALGLFIVGMVLSGLSAFPLQWEVSILNHYIRDGQSSFVPMRIEEFITFVHRGIEKTYAQFPFFAYGTDWLGFGHLIIAAFFVLPFIDPIRYRAVLYVGLLACAGVIAVALIAGPIRGIPFCWSLIDCAFGILGAIPLAYCLWLTRRLGGSADVV